MKQELRQKQKMNMSMVYAIAGVSTLLIVGVLAFIFNVGNVKYAVAGSEVKWEGKADSNWNNSANWSTGKMPSNGDDIIITNKYKYAPVISSNSSFEVDRLTIQDGGQLWVRATLSVADDIELMDKNSLLKISAGNVLVKDHIYITSSSSIQLNGGKLEVEDDITIDGGSFIQSGVSELAAEANTELISENSTFILNNGTANLQGNLNLFSVDDASNVSLKVTGGKLTVTGLTIFSNKNSTENAQIIVTAGEANFNKFSRDCGLTGYEEGSYNFKVTGGTVNFLDELIMGDQSNGTFTPTPSSPCDEATPWSSTKEYQRVKTETIYITYDGKTYRMLPKIYWSKNDEPSKNKKVWEEVECKDYCDLAAEWACDTEYNRKNGGEEIYVSYKGVVYEMAYDVWWSENHQPDLDRNSTYWTKVKKCSEYTAPTCGSVKAWDSEFAYSRTSADEVIQVFKDGKIYTMKTNKWYSRANDPTHDSRVWKYTADCPDYNSGGNTAASKDKLVHDGGMLKFFKAWERPKGFESKNDGTVQLKNTSSNNALFQDEKFVNLIIDPDVTLDVEGDVYVSGNIVNYSSKVHKGDKKIILNGTAKQEITGTENLYFNNIQIANTKAVVALSQDVTILNTLILDDGAKLVAGEKSGNKKTTYATVLVQDDATIEYGEGAYIEGAVIKEGNDAFVFPVGKNGRAAYLTMSAPASNCTFKAEYFDEPAPASNSLNTGLKRVSVVEHWTFERLSGVNDVDVTLHWNDGTYSFISDPSQLLIASFDGNKWNSIGNGAVTGNAQAGTITNSIASTNYQMFTFGSNNNANALPVELIKFTAERNDADVELNWSTASEVQNDYFSLLRSTDGVNFESITTIEGHGNSLEQNDYAFIDQNAPALKLYYRLKQIDFDGTENYSEIITVNAIGSDNLEPSSVQIISSFPNPFVDRINIKVQSEQEGTAHLQLLDLNGSVIANGQAAISANLKEQIIQLDVNAGIPSGNYILYLNLNGSTTTYKVVKR